MKFNVANDTFIFNSIKQLKNGTAPGPDKIPTKLIKDAGEGILERIVDDQVYDYLRSCDILTTSHSAIQKLCSTITSLINSTEFWYETIDRKKVDLAIFLDLKKAFDTVDYKILLEKLEAHGIRELAGNWFRSYLEDRQQYCKLNCYVSRAKTITCGVPQGPCLGPLPFIVYLNDFEKWLKATKAGMYSDDTQVSLASSNVDELVRKAQDELCSISEWMRLSKLSANPQKTEYVFIGHPNRTNKITEQEELKLNDSEMKRVKNTKSLG